MADQIPSPAAHPSLVGRFQLVRVIGVGGMGSVYEGVHVHLGLRVAIKTLKPALAENTITSTRFHREGIVAARVRHPNAVSVYDVIEERGVSFLVMEFLEGETLKDMLDRERPTSVTRILDVLIPVMSAVAAAHDEGVVHRDLKPANIFLARERTGAVTPKVLDFGLSWAADEERPAGDITRSGVVLGTLLYMAPEQVRNARQASAASDQYALGVILYQALTGQRLFLRESQYDTMNAIVAGEHPTARSVRPELPEALDAAIERAIQVDPAKRFASMTAFARAVLPFASPSLQHVWAPAFELPSPELAAPTPVSSLPSVAAPLPPTPSAAPEQPDAWLARSPSRAVLVGGVACVVCLALGVAIGSSVNGAPTPATPLAAPEPPAPAPAAAAPVAAEAPATPPVAAPVRQAATPLVQQLRVGASAPAPVVVDGDAGAYVPRYSRPQFRQRVDSVDLAAPEGSAERR